MNAMTLGEKIALLRTAANMSQEQLSEYLSVSRQSVSKWEMNQADPHIDKLIALCELFGVSADNLLRGDVALPKSNDPASAPSGDAAQLPNRYFGTDGFRGEVNVDITTEQAFAIGRFLGWYYANPLSGCRERNYRPKIVVGKDTRRSSYTLEYAIAAGVTASGADVYMLHVTTTPSVSYVTRHEDFDCGVMISASHNPFTDNGIKLVNRYGEKMDDGTLRRIEAALDGKWDCLGLPSGGIPLAKRESIGAIFDHAAGRNRYIGYLISLATHSCRSLRIGLDCANGASWMIAPAVFDALGAKTYVIHAQPDGRNINRDAGATHIEALQKYVRENNLDVGFAFDGDADRCIAVDENGSAVGGDAILYILAQRLKSHGNLDHDAVVATVQSNMGLVKALGAAGIRTIRTAVGDRHVYEAMMEHGCKLGGEPCGHTILQKYATTGDGILTALMLTEEMLDRKTTLSKLSAPVELFPQAQRNVRVFHKTEAVGDPDVVRRTEELNRSLRDNGRVLIRESGTEPVVRITVEAADAALCESYADSLAELLRKKGHVRA